MNSTKSRRTPDQQLALERKLGTALLGVLAALFLMVLSARIGGFGWSEKPVEVNVGGPIVSNSDGSPSPYQNQTAASGGPREPWHPPEVHLPPAPPPVVGSYPLPKLPSTATVSVPPPKTPSPAAPATGDRYAPASVAVAPVAPKVAAQVPTHAPPAPVIPAAPMTMPREPGVAAIGLVAGTEPIVPERMPASNATQPTVSTTPPKPYVFAEGDNLWLIAQKAYGDGSYYRALFAYNQDRYPHPEDLRPGDKLDVPSTAELRSKFPQLCPAPTAAIQR